MKPKASYPFEPVVQATRPSDHVMPSETDEMPATPADDGWQESVADTNPVRPDWKSLQTPDPAVYE